MHYTTSAATGVNVKAEMARRGLSQQDIGAHLGMSQAAVSAKIAGKTPFTIDQLAAIAALMNIALEALTEGVAA